jgi:hypothetical protein
VATCLLVTLVQTVTLSPSQGTILFAGLGEGVATCLLSHPPPSQGTILFAGLGVGVATCLLVTLVQTVTLSRDYSVCRAGRGCGHLPAVTPSPLSRDYSVCRAGSGCGHLPAGDTSTDCYTLTLSRDYSVCRAGSGCGHLPTGDTSTDCHPLKGVFCLQGWERVWPPAYW